MKTMRTASFLALVACLIVGSGSVQGMLLIVDDTAGRGGMASQADVQDSWREAHSTGAYRLREIARFALPLLLILAAALSLILPSEKDAGRRPRDDDVSF